MIEKYKIITSKDYSLTLSIEANNLEDKRPPTIVQIAVDSDTSPEDIEDAVVKLIQQFESQGL